MKKTNKIKSVYENNRFIIWIAAALVLIEFIYLSISTANVPFMDYWNYIASLGDSIFKGVSFYDIWNLNGVHHTPIQTILWLLNIWLFDWNIQLATFAAAILTSINLIIIYRSFCKAEHSITSKSKMKSCIVGLLFALVLLNLNAWEILTLEFSLVFSLIITALALLSHFLTNTLIHNKSDKNVHLVEFGLLSAIAICGLLGAAFASYYVSAIIVICAHFCFRFKTERYKYIIGYISSISIMSLAVMIYIFVGSASSSLTNTVGNLELSFAFIIEMLKNLFLVLSTSFVATNDSYAVHYIAGIITFGCYFIAFGMFLYKKIYAKSYMPLIFMSFSFGTALLIALGRDSYYTSSRYAGYEVIGIVGILWCFYAQTNRKPIATPLFKKLQLSSRIIVICSTVILSLLLLISYSAEFKYGPHRRHAALNLISKIENIETSSDEELAAFQAHSPYNVRVGVTIMEEYNLGCLNKNKD